MLPRIPAAVVASDVQCLSLHSHPWCRQQYKKDWELRAGWGMREIFGSMPLQKVSFLALP
jgi:hypothetical protein